MKAIVWFLLAAACGAGLGLPEAAAEAASGPAGVGAVLARGEARPVPAWLEFCERLPAECLVDLAEPETVRLTPALRQLLARVNARVNAAVAPMTDDDHWGVPDVWGYPADGYGDCEDYQLMKRRLLAAAGLPRRALRMTVVIDETGNGHAVLMVRTDRGDYILDNKTRRVLPWHRTGYTFVKREGAEGAGWASLGGVTSPTTTANR